MPYSGGNIENRFYFWPCDGGQCPNVAARGRGFVRMVFPCFHTILKYCVIVLKEGWKAEMTGSYVDMTFPQGKEASVV